MIGAALMAAIIGTRTVKKELYYLLHEVKMITNFGIPPIVCMREG